MAAPVNTAIEDDKPLDPSAQRELLIQQLLDQAFVINDHRLQGYLRTHIEAGLAAGQSISTRDLPIDSAADLLAVAHAIECAARQVPNAQYQFVVRYLNRQYHNAYFSQADDFTLTLEPVNDQ